MTAHEIFHNLMWTSVVTGICSFAIFGLYESRWVKTRPWYGRAIAVIFALSCVVLLASIIGEIWT